MSDCLFCRILEGAIPATKVHEDELCLGFKDIHPFAPTHVLFIPRQHLPGVNDVGLQDRLTVGHLVYRAGQYAREAGVADSGYRLVVNTGAHANQSVFHLHLHLLAGRQMEWPPG